MLVAGSKAEVFFWDLRQLPNVVKPLVTFTESHTEDVTKVELAFSDNYPKNLY